MLWTTCVSEVVTFEMGIGIRCEVGESAADYRRAFLTSASTAADAFRLPWNGSPRPDAMRRAHDARVYQPMSVVSEDGAPGFGSLT